MKIERSLQGAELSPTPDLRLGACPWLKIRANRPARQPTVTYLIPPSGILALAKL